MPFSETRHGNPPNERSISAKQWGHIYERWIKKAVESYKGARFTCKRSPLKPGNFIKGIIADIASADLLIADLTGGKPNVYYELGIRHTLRTGSIIITQHLSALPSDLANYFAFEYTYSEKDFEYESHFREFESSLHNTIKALDESEDPSDSPVSDFLGLRHQILERTAAEEREEFLWLLENIGETLSHNYQICEEMYDSIVRGKDVEFCSFPVIDLFPLETLYTSLFLRDWRILRPKNLNSLAQLLTLERRKFHMYAALLERISLGNPDDHVLAEAFTSLGKAIVGGRSHFQKHWQKVLGAKIQMKIVWKSSKKHTKNSKRRSGRK